MARVYLDTSFVSACVSARTDTLNLYRRELSQNWMASQSTRHNVFISAEVLTELGHPEFRQREAALEVVRHIPILELNEQIVGFARILVREKVMPGPISGDCLHVATSCVHQIDYLLTWNIRHLANPNKVAHLRAICSRAGLLPPAIMTPEALRDAL